VITWRFTRGAAALLLAGLLASLVTALPSAAQPSSRTFPETGKTVQGTFLTYWQQHGGLAQQGYPISDQMQEQSATDGKTYTVQYFERAIFELHPENQPPYNVLLSLLGNFRYQQKYPNGAPGQSAATAPGTVRFAQTGKHLGGRFLTYWQQHGGLAQQGYPISEEFMERSDLDGKLYKVQYFERAVFEYHPENQAPYDVLLSQLGKFRYQERGGTQPPPATGGISATNAARVALTGKLEGHASTVTGVAFAPDGQTIATASQDSTVKLWRAADGKLLRTLQGADGMTSVAFAPDGQTLAAGSKDNTVRIWRVSDGQPVHTITGHSYMVQTVAYSRDGQTLASGSLDGTVKLWRAADGALLRTLDGGGSSVNEIAFASDGTTLAAALGNKTVRLWHVADGAPLRTLTGHTDIVHSVAFAPDGQTLASAAEDGTIRLWRVADGAALRTLAGHTDGVYAVAFSPDGSVLASGSYDETVRLWRAADGAALRTLEGHKGSIQSVAFAPNGATLATASSDDTVGLWKAR
jgi:WD40 repeat protein